MALTKVNLSNIVENVLPVANGGTGSSTLSGATVYTGLAVFGSGSTLGGATNPIVAMTGAATSLDELRSLIV